MKKIDQAKIGDLVFDYNLHEVDATLTNLAGFGLVVGFNVEHMEFTMFSTASGRYEYYNSNYPGFRFLGPDDDFIEEVYSEQEESKS